MGHKDPPSAPLSGAAFFGAGLALAWLVLWTTGWPLPNGDDGFFSGAAIHWARTGVLANPWITGWIQWIPGVRTDRYFVQPPFHPWVLALWLKAFGISAPSLTGFACAADGLAAWGAALVLRRLGAGWFAAGSGALMIGVYLLSRGLRPETLGLAFLFLGQSLMLAPGRGRWIAGAVLTMACCGAHAFLFALAAPALLLHLGRAGLEAARTGDDRDFREKISGVAAAAAIVLFVLAAAVRGDFAAFLHDFRGHARLVTPPSGQKLRHFFAQLTVGFELFPNLLALGGAALLLGALAVRAPALRRPLAFALAAFLLLVVLGIDLYAQFSASYVVLAAAFAALAASGWTTGAWRPALCLPALALAGWGIMEEALQYRVDHRDPPAGWEAARRYAAESRPDALIFDAATLRYVFGFAPPEPAADIAWAWSKGLDARRWSPARLGPRDLWVVNSASLHGTSQEKLAPPSLRLRGRTIGSVRVANGLAVIAGTALAPPPPGSFLFLRSSNFVYPDQLH